VPAAAQLSCEHVLQLLEGAVSNGRGKCTAALWQLPAAVHLSSEHVLQLLKGAVSRGNSIRTAALCQLPAAEHISTDQVLRLLKAMAAAVQLASPEETRSEQEMQEIGGTLGCHSRAVQLTSSQTAEW
jgi:ATP:corrinoid adenosyltransferase